MAQEQKQAELLYWYVVFSRYANWFISRTQISLCTTQRPQTSVALERNEKRLHKNNVLGTSPYSPERRGKEIF